MPDKKIINSYQQAYKDFVEAKKSLQKTCDVLRDAKISLTQTWLNENYPDILAKVFPNNEDTEFSIAYNIEFDAQNLKYESEAEREKFQKDLFWSLKIFLKSVENAVKDEE